LSQPRKRLRWPHITSNVRRIEVDPILHPGWHMPHAAHPWVGVGRAHLEHMRVSGGRRRPRRRLVMTREARAGGAAAAPRSRRRSGQRLRRRSKPVYLGLGVRVLGLGGALRHRSMVSLGWWYGDLAEVGKGGGVRGRPWAVEEWRRWLLEGGAARQRLALPAAGGDGRRVRRRERRKGRRAAGCGRDGDKEDDWDMVGRLNRVCDRNSYTPLSAGLSPRAAQIICFKFRAMGQAHSPIFKANVFYFFIFSIFSFFL
jgi:hypothetical protein